MHNVLTDGADWTRKAISYPGTAARPNRLALALGVSVLWSQRPQPHLKNGSAYRQNRLT